MFEDYPGTTHGLSVVKFNTKNMPSHSLNAPPILLFSEEALDTNENVENIMCFMFEISFHGIGGRFVS